TPNRVIVERLSVRPPPRDGIKEDAFPDVGFGLSAERDTCYQVGVLVRKYLHCSEMTEMAHGVAQMKERAAAAHDELPVIRIDDGAGAAPIRVKFQRVVANVEKPRLRIVAGRSQHGVTQ